ncbi:MAG TPA: DUF305 domain-containing protein [Thermomicrobiales bacterium]|nr:DUF305 domain-containing protein [Thermomicrobiales bacterium]
MQVNRDKLLFFGVLALIVVLVAGGFVVRETWDRAPGEDSAEAGFLRDMQVHHTQAVEMAMIIRDRTEDEQIEAMATDIAFSQTSQIGQMQGYLLIWNINPTGDEPAMAWMGHEVEGRMPGMASEEQINALQELPVDRAETLFLQLMNRHHLAGVDMAEAVIERSDNDEIEELAASMVRVQAAEIEVMNQFLAERGYEPVTLENMDEIDLVTGDVPDDAKAEEHGGH